MTMDPRLSGLSVSVNGLPASNQQLPLFQNPTFIQGPMFGNTFLDSGFGGGIQYVPHEGAQNGEAASSTQSSTLTVDEEFPEDCDFSDAVLRYISQMLMEEDMDDKACMLQESLDLQAAEKSLYEVIGKKYPPSPEIIHQKADADFFAVNSGGYLEDIVSMPSWNDSHTQSLYRSSYSSSNSTISGVDGILESPSSILQIPDLASESRSIWQFNKGVEEANRFLPNSSGFLDDLESRKVLSDAKIKVETRDDIEYSQNGSRGRKNPLRENDDDEEERCSKQAAVFAEPVVRSEKFDLVLLCSGAMEGGRNHLTVLREALNDGADTNMLKNGQSKAKGKGSSSGRGRKNNKQGKKEVIDLRTLLISCAQSVAADDRISTNELLKQIRQHASPFGDGTQRLAQVLADGLEARLAGTGSQIYKGLISKRTTAAEILKAYHLFLAACPFRKLSNFISNKTIMKVAETSTRIHIIDFGILYGFQWPTMIQRLSMRPNGPPRVRITGIEFPQPGFRPAERVEETGRRLAAYAEKFGVPFEYTAIAKKWETVQIEELKIDRDELLIVNCLYRSKNLLDETVLVDSPRKMVHDLIGRIKPDFFIHGIVNGSYNAPFFVTRFREAMFHFSALFDMLETLVPRENRERMVIEKEIFGREALNVIACEGWERVERPETYKQWQVRDLRAGFVQVPFAREIVQRATDRARLSYHRDFLIDEDSRWLLQGWKGRIIYALSCWKPA